MSHIINAASCYAKVEDVEWEKINKIYLQCCDLEQELGVITEFSFEALVALGVFFVNSNYKFSEKLYPFFDSILINIEKINFCNPPNYKKKPLEELTAKAICCIINDYASFLSGQSTPIGEAFSEKAINSQLDIITSIFDKISKNDLPSEKLQSLCFILNGVLFYFGEIKSGIFMNFVTSLKIYQPTVKSNSCPDTAMGNRHTFYRRYFSGEFWTNFIDKTFTSSACFISEDQWNVIIDLISSLKASLSTLKEVDKLPKSRLQAGQCESLSNLIFVNFFTMVFNNTRSCGVKQGEYRRTLFLTLKSFYESELVLLSSCLSSRTFSSAHYHRAIRTCSVLLISMGHNVFDDSIAESLWINLKGQINQKMEVSKTILVFPLLLACFEVLTKLANFFPFLASCVPSTIRDFLIEPAPLMGILHEKMFSDEKSNICISEAREVYNELYAVLIARLSQVMKTSLQEDMVHGFLTTLSRRLFTAKSISGPQVAVASNAIHICSEIAIFHKSSTKICNSVLHILSHNYTNSNLSLDKTIVLDLVRMIVAGCDNIYDQALTFLCYNTVELYMQSTTQFDAVRSQMISKAFGLLAVNVKNRIRQNDVLMRLLQIFVKSGTSLISPRLQQSQKSSLLSKVISLLQIIAKLMVRMDPLDNINSTCFFLFCDFWIIVSILGFHSNEICDSWSGDSYSAIRIVACGSPPLSSSDYILKERYGIATRNSLSQMTGDVVIFRNRLLSILDNTDSSVVNRLDVPQCSYLNAIFALENLRTLNCSDLSRAVYHIYNYLEDKHFLKDKLGIHQCVKTMANIFFSNCLNLLINGDKERDAEEIAKFLLVKFNSEEKFICGLADTHLSDLVDKVPHILWNRNVLVTLLDIFHLLTNFDGHYISDSIPVEGTDSVLELKETLAERKESATIFHSRCTEMLNEAIKFAPGRTKSNLIQYLIDRAEKYSNPTISLLIQSLAHSYSNDVQNFKSTAVHVIEHQYFSFISILQRRVAFFNEVKVLAGMKDKSLIFAELNDHFDQAVKIRSFENFERALYKMSALLILNKENDPLNKRLVNFIAFSPLNFFSDRSVMCAVSCWEWIMSIKSEKYELELIIAISKAFAETCRRKMGFFNTDISENDPLTQRKGDLQDFPLTYSLKAHEPWLIFLHERVENRKYSNQSFSDILMYMMILCLTIKKQLNGRIFSSTVLAFGSVSKFLSIGYSLIQTEANTSRNLSWNLRRVLYYAVVRFFSCNPMTPQYSGSSLRRDILYMNSLWNYIYREKKFLQHSGDSSDSSSFVSSKNNVANRESNSVVVARRSFLLVFLAVEIERLIVWHNPMDLAELSELDDKVITSWRAAHVKDKYLVEYCSVAWKIYPPAAIFFAIRIRNSETVNSEVRRLVRQDPVSVNHIPEALLFFVSTYLIESDSSSLNHVITWAICSPVLALSFFTKTFPAHPTLQKYAITVLESYSVDVVLRYLLQIVQCLRNDKLGFMQAFILFVSSRSQLLAHQFLWNLKGNLSRGDEGSDAKISTIAQKVTEDIIGLMSEDSKRLYNKQFEFIDEIINVSGIIREFPKGRLRNEACVEALEKISVVENCYLPSNPECIILDIDSKSAVSLQSAEKAPYLVSFKVQQMQLDEVELTCQGKMERPKEGNVYWLGAIMKVGDDVRQDALALQFMELFAVICKNINLNVYFRPYKVVSTSLSSGVIECVPSCKSRSKIGDETDTSLFDYFKSTYGGEKSQNFIQARKCFIESMAAYSVFCYLLQIKDRHNGNIMISDCGHIIHIDFGFLFETSPGGNLGWEPDFKLTEEMLQIMGGRVDSPHFQYFTELCIKAFLAIRPYTDSILTLVNLMTDSGFPCFRGNSVRLLSSRLNPSLSYRAAAQHMRKIIDNCCLSIRSRTYDVMQYMQNKIAY